VHFRSRPHLRDPGISLFVTQAFTVLLGKLFLALHLQPLHSPYAVLVGDVIKEQRFFFFPLAAQGEKCELFPHLRDPAAASNKNH
jgi:hypothetical protein